MKRFTATEKWEKTWFQDLAPHHKCLWQYMCDRCDCAGVWEMNWKVASLFIGKTLSVTDLEHFKGRVAMFGTKLVIRGFVEFQYGKLSEDCKAHNPIFRALAKHSLSKGYVMAMSSLKEMEEESEEEKEPEADGSQGNGAKPPESGYTVPECFAKVDGFTAALGGWIESRKKMRKPPTGRAIQLMVNTLAERPNSAIAALNKCVQSGWQGFDWKWIDKDGGTPPPAAPKPFDLAIWNAFMDSITDADDSLGTARGYRNKPEQAPPPLKDRFATWKRMRKTA